MIKLLSVYNVYKNPIKQFSLWYSYVLKLDLIHPDAMTLATSNSKGKPSARIVLLKSFDEDGFIFFTNYKSRKGIELQENPFAALLFYWEKLSGQVRIEGKVKKISEKESDLYFNTRPRGSKLGTWVSAQSSVIANRGVLEKKFKELELEYKDKKIPRPDFWGGFRLIPDSYEFWLSGENRLHDRIKYTKTKTSWKIERLAP